MLLYFQYKFQRILILNRLVCSPLPIQGSEISWILCCNKQWPRYTLQDKYVSLLQSLTLACLVECFGQLRKNWFKIYISWPLQTGKLLRVYIQSIRRIFRAFHGHYTILADVFSHLTIWLNHFVHGRRQNIFQEGANKWKLNHPFPGGGKTLILKQFFRF